MKTNVMIGLFMFFVSIAMLFFEQTKDLAPAVLGFSIGYLLSVANRNERDGNGKKK